MASSLWTRATRVCIHTTQRQALSHRVVLTQCRSNSSQAAAAAASIVFPHSKARNTQRLTQRELPQQGAVDTDKLRPVDSVDAETTLDPGAPVEKPFDQPKPKEAEENKLPKFETLKGRISYDTLKAITVKPHKLTHMSPVQAEVLPLLPQIAEPYSADPPADGSPRPPRDLLVKARTGTGKTLAFLVPAIEARLQAIEASGRQAVKDAGLNSDKQLEGRARRIFTREQVGTLIISPTRELATQIANEALRLTHHHKDFEVRLFVGGQSKRMQMRDWMKGRRDIVVATPGRLRDLLMSEPEVVRGISKTKTFVLDEADTLLDMGFRDDIDAITEYLPKTPERQTFLFSATVSRSIQQVARQTLDKNHIFINTVSDKDSPVHAHVPQYHTVLPTAHEQIPHVLRLLAHDQLINPGASKSIVFLPTTKMTQLFATILRELSRTVLPSKNRTKVYEIHSKRPQDSRTMTSDAFRADKTGSAILVTSDVSARGVDYPGVSRVIQVGIPAGPEQYIHRVGRCGRAGTTGRGDLVLLPWECGFVTWQLTSVPLKPLTTDELKSQIAKLSEKYDADPNEAWKAVPQTSVGYDKRGRSAQGPTQYSAPVATALAEIPTSVSKLLENIDEEAVGETFAASLGYYISKAPELRIQKDIIVQGCKDWAVEACGLPTPPYVSQAFLQRLGYSDGRTKRFGQRMEAPRSSPGGGPSWMGRGAQRSKSDEKPLPAWVNTAPTESGDPRGRPEDYRTQRYGKAVDSRSSRASYGSNSGGYSNRGGGGGYGQRSGGGGYGQQRSGGDYGMRR